MQKYIIILLLPLLLMACGKNQTNEYVGKWVNVKSEKNTLEIVNNGDNLLVKNTMPNVARGTDSDPLTITRSYPAVYKDGGLQMSSELGPTSLVIDKSTGHLTGDGAEYQRGTN